MKKYTMILFFAVLCSAQSSQAGHKGAWQLLSDNGIDMAQAITIFCGAYGYSAKLTLERPASRVVTHDVLRILSAINLGRAVYRLVMNAS